MCLEGIIAWWSSRGRQIPLVEQEHPLHVGICNEGFVIQIDEESERIVNEGESVPDEEGERSVNGQEYVSDGVPEDEDVVQTPPIITEPPLLAANAAIAQGNHCLAEIVENYNELSTPPLVYFLRSRGQPQILLHPSIAPLENEWLLINEVDDTTLEYEWDDSTQVIPPTSIQRSELDLEEEECEEIDASRSEQVVTDQVLAEQNIFPCPISCWETDPECTTEVRSILRESGAPTILTGAVSEIRKAVKFNESVKHIQYTDDNPESCKFFDYEEYEDELIDEDNEQYFATDGCDEDGENRIIDANKISKRSAAADVQSLVSYFNSKTNRGQETAASPSPALEPVAGPSRALEPVAGPSRAREPQASTLTAETVPVTPAVEGESRTPEVHELQNDRSQGRVSLREKLRKLAQEYPPQSPGCSTNEPMAGPSPAPSAPPTSQFNGDSSESSDQSQSVEEQQVQLVEDAEGGGDEDSTAPNQSPELEDGFSEE